MLSLPSASSAVVTLYILPHKPVLEPKAKICVCPYLCIQLSGSRDLPVIRLNASVYSSLNPFYKLCELIALYKAARLRYSVGILRVVLTDVLYGTRNTIISYIAVDISYIADILFLPTSLRLLRATIVLLLKMTAPHNISITASTTTTVLNTLFCTSSDRPSPASPGDPDCASPLPSFGTST